ncbi:MAG: periplasmic heavy metal sensor [Anderseniella sp.]
MSDHIPPRKRKWSWVWVALVVSLALNFGVLAAIITHEVRGPGRHGITGPGFSQVLPRAFFRHLDNERREELVGELRDYRKDFRDIRTQLRAHARTLADALRAEPYDEKAIADALTSYDEEARSMLGRGRQVAEGFFKKLTPQERKAMADEIERKSMSKRQWRNLQKERGN